MTLCDRASRQATGGAFVPAPWPIVGCAPVLVPVRQAISGTLCVDLKNKNDQDGQATPSRAFFFSNLPVLFSL
jgi:hypothetical protein